MATLPITLPYCAATHGYIALRRESKGVVKRVKTCVLQRLNAHNHANGIEEQINVDDDNESDFDDNDSLEQGAYDATTPPYDFESGTEQYEPTVSSTQN